MSETSSAYRVLARKYRPTRLSDLLGQDALVRTLTNAIATGRIAHAFVLTGVRGVGKTPTAPAVRRPIPVASARIACPSPRIGTWT
jgi:DNA polymerase-3 subunit gamma/tau